MGDRQSVLAVQNQVADEVRAHLGRRRLSARQAAFSLGWTQGYIAKRMTGTVAFDVADLAALSDLLDVPIGEFFPPRRSSGSGPRNALYWRAPLAA